MSERGVPISKVMSFGSDGASAMMGKEKGVAAILRRENPHMHNVHCVAHRLALCTSQVAEKIESLRKHQQVLTDLFYYFKGSSQRDARLHAIQEILDDPCIVYKELHSVRWLSYFNALTAVWRTLDSLLTYLAEASHKDHKAGRMKKKIATESFIATTYMMIDAMAPVTILSQSFQKENVDVALVKVKTGECIANLQKVYTFDTPYMQKLKEDLKGNTFKEHHQITRNNFSQEKIAKNFIDSLVDNIRCRFPADDLLTSFGILAMRPISMMLKTEVDRYGDEEIDRLCTYYGETKTVQWEISRTIERKTSDPVGDFVKAKSEWAFLKKVVLAEKYHQGVMSKLWHLIDYHHLRGFSQLAQVSSTCTNFSSTYCWM
ncbi:hypothetical protein ACJMK2_032125 [Sinanodonta woodiana]|uniref:Zinc finger protein 862-like n=1 Tax=Sinanodonta woodiana TaxID=1069815 RepID=A0ABD3X0S8_SINWO